MSVSVIPNDLAITRNSTELRVVAGSTTPSVVGNDVSTAITGSTVLTAAVATAAELNATNALVNEIKAALVALGVASS